MREKPRDFSDVVAVQWLCAAVDRFLGLTDLADVPALLTGFASITDHPGLSAFARSAFTLRQLGVHYTSESGLRQAVYDFLTWEEDRRDSDPAYVDQPYAIDPRSRRMSFRRTAGDDPRISQWTDALAAGMPLKTHGMPTASPDRPFSAPEQEAGGRRITLDLSDVPPGMFDRPRHDTAATARHPVVVPLSELQAIAERFDAMDAADPDRVLKGWGRRFIDAAGARKVDVLRPGAGGGGLEAVDEIRLDGLKHLIGLPGTGKTTLVTLLVAWLHERGLRTVVLLPSIEVCFNLMSELASYGLDIGLLMGQSPETRLRHARKLAERIGSRDETRGLGRTVEFADLLSVNCALAGFDDAHDDERPFPQITPPCAGVMQRQLKAGGGERNRESTCLCPAASWCGRMKAARQLTERHVWLGHAMSLDTRLPPHFSDEHIRHFEAVARNADVVIADEVDGIQAVLDRQAVAEISITGARSSYESRLLDDLLRPFALGENDRTGSNIGDYANKATRFIDLNRSLIRQLQNDRTATGSRFLAEYDDAFVTGNRVMADLFGDAARSRMDDRRRADEDERVGALMAFWDACIRQALFRSSDAPTDERDFDVRRTAVALNTTDENVQAVFGSCVESVLDWISYPSSHQKAEAVDRLRETMFAFAAPNAELAPARAHALFSFLVNVSSVIMQFLSLLPAQHVMMAEGVHRSPIFRDGLSADFSRMVPDAVIGTLAGVRFMFQVRNRRSSLVLHYVTFEGAPRMLLYRLHELLRHDASGRGPNVLLTSATSFLADSPAFHVPVGPDYVLRRTSSDESWRESRYMLRPVRDPQNPGRALRFSGARYEDRERVLRAMTDHFVKGDTPALPSLVNDRFSRGRKLALVVNSYDQVRLVKEHATAVAERLGRRIVAVVDRVPENGNGEYVTAAQVEQIGQRNDWDAVVFPMKALSRGVNVVFGGPAFVGTELFDKAAIGTVAFLTRPHPAQESFDFVAGIVGRSSLRFDTARFPSGYLPGDLSRALRVARRDTLADVRRLLRHSVRIGTLGDLRDAFVADVMIDVVQTIGRSMRNGCKTRVLFVDSAWAPNSMRPGNPGPDTPRTSYLAAMHLILGRLVDSPDPVEREIYEALYRPYFDPLCRCDNLILSHAQLRETS